MRFTPRQLAQHEVRRDGLRKTFIDPKAAHQIAKGIAAGASNVVNLESFFDYTPAEWTQGSCGDCWIWGSTAASSIMMTVAGTKDLLSVQYMNSGYNGGSGSWACCGGDTPTFATWYNGQGMFIPDSNAGASFADGNNSCTGSTAEPASSIATTPNHPIQGMSVTVVPTTGITQAQAILNIKTLLSQNQPLAFSYFLPGAGWDDFESFWSSSPESTPWASIDAFNGQDFGNGGGGHLVCLVGYDDTDNTWIIQNSWGTTSGRPHGTFKIPQAMGYGDTLTYSGQTMNQYEFDAYTIGLPRSVNTVTASITSPADGTTVVSGKALAFKGTGTDSSPSSPLTYTWAFGDGGTATGASVSHTYTNTTSAALPEEVTLTATDSTGAKGSTSLQVNVGPAAAPAAQLLLNPGFEQGPAGWAASRGVIGANGPLEPAHSGTGDAWLCGYSSAHADSLSQTVALPASATSATLGFFLHVDTAETTTTAKVDTLTVEVRNASGKVLSTLGTFSNLDAAAGYATESFTLGDYAGQTVQIHLAGVQKGAKQTSFVVDDFSLKVP
jgi:uncharacterized protein YndB with AHSA1/START domain